MATVNLKATVTSPTQPNPLPPPPPLPPSTNAFCIGQTFPSSEIRSAERIYQVEKVGLTVFDVTSDMFPPMYSDVGDKYVTQIKIRQITQYNLQNTSIVQTNYETRPYFRCNGEDGIGTPVYVGQIFDIDVFKPSRSDIQFSGPYVTNNMGVTTKYGFYVKFVHLYNDGTESQEGILRFYWGAGKVMDVTFNDVCLVNITPWTMNTLNINNFQNLNYSKPTYDDYFTASESFAQSILQGINTEGDTFIPKITFLSNEYTSDPDELIEVHPNLLLNDKPVYEGQTISSEIMDLGLLKFDASNMTDEDINNVRLKFGIVGFASGETWTKMI